MRKTARRFLSVAGALVLLAVAAILGIYSASRRPPAFYRQALAASPETLAEEGQQFEHAALDLHNQLQEAGKWQALLTQDQINGWLATDLPAKFPHALPPAASQPRIAIGDGEFQIAVHYQQDGVDTVLSLAGDVHLTSEPNEVALRIDRARAGLLPVPLSRIIQEITTFAARSRLPLRWTEARGAPVALVRVPFDLDDDGKRRVLLDRLDLSQGTLHLAGRTLEGPAGAGQPRPMTAGQPGEKETRQR